MMLRKLMSRTIAVAAAVILALNVPFSPFESQSVSADSTSLFSPLQEHKDEPGNYCYHFDGRLTNPCHENSIREKSNVIGSFWFEFTYVEDNGLGEQRTERLDLSYDGSRNKNSGFVNEHFVRPNDNETGLSFDLNIPGQLTSMKIHLELNGSIGFFSYERMSFEIKSVTANGIKVNTNTDYVSSSVNSSEAKIGFRMDKPDSAQVASAFSKQEVTLNQFRNMINNGEIRNQLVADKYGSVLTDSALNKLADTYDGDINQGFSHSDEPGMYYYTLKMLIDNPVNVSGSDSDTIEEFVIDFTYNDDEHYKLDMSWDSAKHRNLNPSFAELFCRPDDDETTATMNVWVPGRVSKINVVLDMSDSEQLSVTFSDVLIGGMKVNRKTDYVSSMMFTSKAEIECSVPESLIDLSGLSDERITEVLDAIYTSDENADFSDVRDQFGSLIGKEQLEAAHDDMTKCIAASENDPRASYADVIDGFYMYKTVYRAESVSALQEFIQAKRAAKAGA